MPTVNTAKHMVTTPSVPPTSVLTRAGSKDSATKPTSQNQDTMRATPQAPVGFQLAQQAPAWRSRGWR